LQQIAIHNRFECVAALDGVHLFVRKGIVGRAMLGAA